MLPKEDKYYATKSELLDQLKTLLGGRVAEDLVLKEISTGAQNDLERATEMVRKMIMEYGMSSALGPITFGHKREQVFLGRDISRDRNYSEEVAQEIDKDVRNTINDAYNNTEDMLSDNLEKLHIIAQALIEHETLAADELTQLMENGVILPKAKKEDFEEEEKAELIKKPETADDGTQKEEEEFTPVSVMA